MSTTETLLDLKVHKLSNEAYNSKNKEGSLDNSALYLTPAPKLVYDGIIDIEETETEITFSVKSGADGQPGVVKLSDSTSSDLDARSGKTAATPKAVKTAYDLAANHTHLYAGSSSAGGAANSVKAALTFSTSGNGADNNTTYNGSTAKTISYNSVGAAAQSHTHDDRYYTESEVDSKLAGKSNTNHTHTLKGGWPNGVNDTDANKTVVLCIE